MNIYPHRIHLKGPWDYEPLTTTILHADGRIEASKSVFPAARPVGRMTLPCRWAEGGLGPFNGRVRFHRRFHWPGTLDYYERLWLRFAAVDYFARIWLNDHELGAHEGTFDPFEFDVTHFIQLRNDLVVEVDLPGTSGPEQRLFRGPPNCPPASGGLWGAVSVEVRREAFLRNVRAYAHFSGSETILHVHGEAVGIVDHPLELYILVDGTTLVYQRVEATPAGRAFHVQTKVLVGERWRAKPHGEPRVHDVTVDLVDGASRLTSVVLPFGFRKISDARTLKRVDEADALSVVLNENEEVRAWCVDLHAPLVEAEEFERANKEGTALVLRLPLAGCFATDGSCQTSLVRQACAMVTHLQHHPSVVGWLLHRASPIENEASDQALFDAVGAIDPTRPCWVTVE